MQSSALELPHIGLVPLVEEAFQNVHRLESNIPYATHHQCFDIDITMAIFLCRRRLKIENVGLFCLSSLILTCRIHSTPHMYVSGLSLEGFLHNMTYNNHGNMTATLTKWLYASPRL